MLLSTCTDQPNHNENSFKKDTADILSVLEKQENAWNQQDFKGFMQGYLNSDSLKFYGRNGLTKGWQNTLDNYIPPK